MRSIEKRFRRGIFLFQHVWFTSDIVVRVPISAHSFSTRSESKHLFRLIDSVPKTEMSAIFKTWRCNKEKGIATLTIFCETTLIILPHWTPEVRVPCFPARTIITYLRLPGHPTPPACHPRFAADRLFKRFSILHAH